MTSHNRRFAAQLRKEACTVGDPRRVAEGHLPTHEGVLASGFTISSRMHAVLPLLGVYRGNSRVWVAHDCLEVRYGPWWFETPLSNVTRVTADDEHVCISFRTPVHGHEPLGFRHHDFTVAVDQPREFAQSLRTRLVVRSVQDGPGTGEER
ncbi:hypothetical protein ABZ863_15360 [Saccharomonospora sp. NPDC046836]|uniref:hypothetical protein n=1 Tax=Saccharomonospora sp. NPDC046836 TaxID=3156921 RepID=UPI0033D6E334